MKIGTHTANKHGEQVYLSYIPSPLPDECNLSESQQVILDHIYEKIETLNNSMSDSPIREAFIKNQIRREALASSIIEGVKASWLTMLFSSSVRNASDLDAVGNMDAIIEAYEQTELPLSNRLIRTLHAKLFSLRPNTHYGVTPGEFRRSQNWIGFAGCGLQGASFIPPNPTDMAKCMEELEMYLNNKGDATDPIIRAALTHYQFETIHPFLDGNGRIGRILVGQQLIDEDVISAPYIAVSPYLLAHREDYYLALSSVRAANTYEPWLDFFLVALEASVDSAIMIFDAELGYYNESVRVIRERISPRMQEKSLEILKYIVCNFASSHKMIAENTSVSKNTVKRYMNCFDELGIVDCHVLTRNISCYIRDCEINLWILREIGVFGNMEMYRSYPLQLQ